MSFEPRDLLRHILEEADYLLDRGASLDSGSFRADGTLQRAFVRSLEIIGEASKKVPADFPRCFLGLVRQQYLRGQTVEAHTFQIVNPAIADRGVEAKLWLRGPDGAPASLVSWSADGRMVLPAGFRGEYGGHAFPTLATRTRLEDTRSAAGFSISLQHDSSTKTASCLRSSNNRSDVSGRAAFQGDSASARASNAIRCEAGREDVVPTRSQCVLRHRAVTSLADVKTSS
jgi:uncharacterized protein with HEPN domain